jgi:hypothetical protein
MEGAKTLVESVFMWWAGQGSNLQPTDYESDQGHSADRGEWLKPQF